MDTQTNHNHKIYKVFGVIFVCWFLLFSIVAGGYALYMLPVVLAIGLSYSFGFFVAIKIFPKHRVVDVFGKWLVFIIAGTVVMAVMVEIIKALGLMKPI